MPHHLQISAPRHPTSQTSPRCAGRLRAPQRGLTHPFARATGLFADTRTHIQDPAPLPRQVPPSQPAPSDPGCLRDCPPQQPPVPLTFGATWRPGITPQRVRSGHRDRRRRALGQVPRPAGSRRQHRLRPDSGPLLAAPGPPRSPPSRVHRHRHRGTRAHARSQPRAPHAQSCAPVPPAHLPGAPTPPKPRAWPQSPGGGKEDLGGPPGSPDSQVTAATGAPSPRGPPARAWEAYLLGRIRDPGATGAKVVGEEGGLRTRLPTLWVGARCHRLGTDCPRRLLGNKGAGRGGSTPGPRGERKGGSGSPAPPAWLEDRASQAVGRGWQDARSPSSECRELGRGCAGSLCLEMGNQTRRMARTPETAPVLDLEACSMQSLPVSAKSRTRFNYQGLTE